MSGLKNAVGGNYTGWNRHLEEEQPNSTVD